jgi:hypothetical protein
MRKIEIHDAESGLWAFEKVVSAIAFPKPIKHEVVLYLLLQLKKYCRTPQSNRFPKHGVLLAARLY